MTEFSHWFIRQNGPNYFGQNYAKTVTVSCQVNTKLDRFHPQNIYILFLENFFSFFWLGLKKVNNAWGEALVSHTIQIPKIWTRQNRYASFWYVVLILQCLEHYKKELKSWMGVLWRADLSGHGHPSPFCQKGWDGRALLGQPSKGQPCRISILYLQCSTTPHIKKLETYFSPLCFWIFAQIVVVGGHSTRKCTIVEVLVTFTDCVLVEIVLVGTVLVEDTISWKPKFSSFKTNSEFFFTWLRE